MTLAVEPTPSTDYQEQRYRALSGMAVASLALGVLSMLTWIDWALGIIPVVGLLLGARALHRIHKYEGELAGARLAQAGITLSIVWLLSGYSWLTYQYVNEVPDGYERISYAQLQPEESTGAATIPPSARRLNGKQIFVKGYVFPGAQQRGITQFVLVRDNGTCCFGGPTPKLTDMIQVTLKRPMEIEYSTRVFSVAGTFRVEPAQAMGDLGQVLYHLDADYIR